MTAAERQKRHRRKLKRVEREVQIAASQARSAELAAHAHPAAGWGRIRHEAALREEWQNMIGQAEHIGETIADELVRQLAEAMIIDSIPVDDIRAALDRRFGWD